MEAGEAKTAPSLTFLDVRAAIEAAHAIKYASLRRPAEGRLAPVVRTKSSTALPLRREMWHIGCVGPVHRKSIASHIDICERAAVGQLTAI